MKPFFHTCEAKSPKGETFYLTMQTMNPVWEYYRTIVDILTVGGNKFIGGTFGSITQLYENIKSDTLDEFLKSRAIPDFWTSNSSLFKQVCDNLSKTNYDKGSRKREELMSITGAVGGMNVKSQTHIVYASRNKPSIPFTERKDSEHLGFERFHECYSDIIMTVGVTIRSNVVENRGICRNPWSIILNDYKNISMILHRFTCKTVSEFFSEVKLFRVRPMQRMAEILVSELPLDNLTIDGHKAKEYEGNFTFERTFEIPIDDMILSK